MTGVTHATHQLPYGISDRYQIMAIAHKTMPSQMPENPTLTTNQMTYPVALPPTRNPSMSGWLEPCSCLNAAEVYAMRVKPRSARTLELADRLVQVPVVRGGRDDTCATAAIQETQDLLGHLLRLDGEHHPRDVVHPVPFAIPCGGSQPRGRTEGDVGSGRSHRADAENATSGSRVQRHPQTGHPQFLSGDSNLRQPRASARAAPRSTSIRSCDSRRPRAGASCGRSSSTSHRRRAPRR
jgi:hypothetical protein